MRPHLGRSRDPLFADLGTPRGFPSPPYAEPEPEPEPDALERKALERSLAIGAKTLAGVCLGVVTVLLGVATAGIALEAVVVPSLLLKLAGGLAGGSIGLAKGLGDERRHERRPGERARDL